MSYTRLKPTLVATAIASRKSEAMLDSKDVYPRELIQDVAKRLVECPDRVKVNVRRDGDSIQICLVVRKRDIWRIAGRGGRTLLALQTIVNALGHRDGVLYDLILQDDEPDPKLL